MSRLQELQDQIQTLAREACALKIQRSHYDLMNAHGLSLEDRLQAAAEVEIVDAKLRRALSLIEDQKVEYARWRAEVQ